MAMIGQGATPAAGTPGAWAVPSLLPPGLAPPGLVPGAAAAPVPGTAPGAAAACAWQEYESGGRKYYHNSVTKESRWEKPAELMSAAERIAAQCPWRVYTAKDGGRAYYYCAARGETTWTMPDEFRTARELLGDADAHLLSGTAGVAVAAASASSAAAAAAAPVSAPAQQVSTKEEKKEKEDKEKEKEKEQKQENTPETTPPREQQEQQEKEEEQEPRKLQVEEDTITRTGSARADAFGSRDEAVRAFMDLLTEKVGSSQRPWEEALLAIMSDRRYGALESLAEKRRAFADWQLAQQAAEAQKQQAERDAAARAFGALLDDAQRAGTLTAASTWRRFALDAARDARFAAVASERVRVRLFDERVAALAQQERDARHRARAAAEAQVRTSLAADAAVGAATRWRDVRERYVRAYGALLPERALEDVFAQHRRALERQAELAARLAKHAARAQARERRDAFRALLKDLHARGLVTAESSWREVQLLVGADPRHQALLRPDYTGSTPRELFDDERTVARAELKALTRRVQAALTRPFVAMPGSTVAELRAALPAPVLDGVPDALVDAVLRRLVRKEAHRAARLEAHSAQFRALLARKAPDLVRAGQPLPFADAYARLHKHDACAKLPRPVAEQLYAAFVAHPPSPPGVKRPPPDAPPAPPLSAQVSLVPPLSLPPLAAVPQSSGAAAAAAAAAVPSSSSADPPAKRSRPGDAEDLEEGEIVD